MDSGELRERVRTLMSEARVELESLVRIPSIAFDGYPREPLDEAARAVEALLRAAGLGNARLVDVPGGPPAVFAERPAPPGRPTVLFYSHYDVQPPGDEAAWTTPPFTPQVRAGRLYGRGAADDKAGVIMHATALRALGAELDVGVKVLIEGEEEAGRGSLDAWVAANRELVRADLIVVADVGNVAAGVPTLTTSLRGMTALEVEVQTLAAPVHSGMYGGAAPDALLALARLLASLVDERGDVAVAGLGRDEWHGADYPEERYRADAGVLDGVALIGTGTLSERLWAHPAVTVVGLDAPPVASATNAVAGRARAKLSVRVPPGQDAAAAQQAVRRHLEAAAPWHVRCTVTPGVVADGFLAQTGGEGYAVVAAALAEAFGREVVQAGEGASIPLVVAFREAVPGAEIVLFGPEEPLCRIHSIDESVSLAELERCILAEALILRGMARIALRG
jgi:cysteinylglycine-S-conjugate dipeptidase